MTAIEKVKKSDRMAVIRKYATTITDGKATIGSLIGTSEDVAECKRHFADFYGEDTKQHSLAHAMLNILLIMDRSIDRQGEDHNKKISQWAKVAPLRTQLIEKIKVLTAEGA